MMQVESWNDGFGSYTRAIKECVYREIWLQIKNYTVETADKYSFNEWI